LGIVCYANAIRQQHLLRQPWNHVLAMGIGVWTAGKLSEYEDHMLVRQEARRQRNLKLFEEQQVKKQQQQQQQQHEQHEQHGDH